MTKGILVGLCILLAAVMVGFGIFHLSSGRTDNAMMMFVGAGMSLVVLILGRFLLPFVLCIVITSFLFYSGLSIALCWGEGNTTLFNELLRTPLVIVSTHFQYQQLPFAKLSRLYLLPVGKYSYFLQND